MNTYKEKKKNGIKEDCDEPEKYSFLYSSFCYIISKYRLKCQDQIYKKQPFLLLLTMI
jgi:hypothetical protein